MQGASETHTNLMLCTRLLYGLPQDYKHMYEDSKQYIYPIFIICGGPKDKRTSHHSKIN